MHVIPVIGFVDGAIWAQTICDVLLGVGIFWIGRKNQKIDQLQEDLERTAKKLIDERIGAIGDKLAGLIENLAKEMKDIKGRLRDGDGQMRGLGERDHNLDMKLVTRIEELKSYMAEHFASREAQIDTAREVHKLTIAVTELKARGH